jgi:hypothetical protein
MHARTSEPTIQIPTGAELLDAWERGQTLPDAVRILPLLGATLPAADWDDLVRLPIGRRDAYLLEIRTRLFGPRLCGVIACPACRSDLELEFAADDIRQSSVPMADEFTLTVDAHGYIVRFRPVDTSDLAALARFLDDPAHARQTLLDRCLITVHRNGEAVGPDSLPEVVVATLAQAMADADPQADVEFALRCATCDNAWSAVFDIAAFLWSELDAWAWRTLDEVHTLARAYGWREADILSLSPWRRKHYLQAVGA